MQIVGPKGSETIPFKNIQDARKTLSLPIPKVIDKDGGSFEVELGASAYIELGWVIADAPWQ